MTENEENLSKPKYVQDEIPEAYLKRLMQTPPTRLSMELDSYISDFQQRLRERVDEACLRALQGGRCGVKVTTNVGEGSILIEVCEEVPFGEIQYVHDFGSSPQFGPL